MIAAALLLALGALVVLALPLFSAPGDARSARAELTKALDSLQAGDVSAARAAVERARVDVDAAQDGVQGLGGDVWSAIPFLGTPVSDARHLTQALDDATSIAEVGVDLVPSLNGDRRALFRGDQVDRGALDAAITGARSVQSHLVSADGALAQVQGTTPVIGEEIAAQRDAAADRVGPAADTFTNLLPMLDGLPAMLGFEGERSYLIALLNPAELRYSGGAALSFAPVTWDQGRVELGESVTPQEDPRLSELRRWRKVVGNTFHRAESRVANSTFAPSWSVSGEELLRAWRGARSKNHDGVLAIDVVGLAQLLEATGPVSTPGYGRITGATLVETLVGSYDDYYPDPTVQDEPNKALIPLFQERLLGGGDFLAKGRALGEAAAGRHFATYFRDDAVQEGARTLGLSGDLTTASGDYVAVATQNTNGSKADYWQKRREKLDVTLARDGSASNRLDVLVDNDSPPYDLPIPDLGSGYFTRQSEMALAVFLPQGITDVEAGLDGEAYDPPVRSFYGHDYTVRPLLLEPSAQARLRLTYGVPDAAEVNDSGGLTYRLAVDPQGTVNPSTLDVTVHLPSGYRATSLPTGWSGEGETLTFRTDALEASDEWEIEIEPDN